MKETVFQRELADAFRMAGWWAYKIPDSPAGQMGVGGEGRLRYNLPKPFDLMLQAPNGLAGAVECKLEKGPTVKVDERFVRQVRSVQDIASRNGYGWIAVNFRYKRASGSRNVAVLIPALSLLDAKGNGVAIGDRLSSEDLLRLGGRELTRVTGGWELTE